MTSKTPNKADAKAMFARLHDGFDQVAAVRQEMRDKGIETPPDLQQMVTNMRTRLRAAGLSRWQIDTTPGLELEPGWGEQ